jgi:hypothetical protein
MPTVIATLKRIRPRSTSRRKQARFRLLDAATIERERSAAY